MVDLTKLILHSDYPAFKNNTVFTGSLTISGTASPGTNTRTFTVPLGLSPDLVDVIFQGPANPSSDRPTAAFFRGTPFTSQNGMIYVVSDDGFGSDWLISSKISGTDLIVTAIYMKTFTGTTNLTSTAFNYRVVDYSTTRSSVISFDSRLNYMKRSSFTGSSAITLGAADAVSTITVTHGLGYIPFWIVGAHLNDTSTIWSSNRVHEYTQSPSFPSNVPVQLEEWSTTTALTIRIINGRGTGQQSGSRTAWWSVYLDYGS